MANGAGVQGWWGQQVRDRLLENSEEGTWSWVGLKWRFRSHFSHRCGVYVRMQVIWGREMKSCNNMNKKLVFSHPFLETMTFAILTTLDSYQYTNKQKKKTKIQLPPIFTSAAVWLHSQTEFWQFFCCVLCFLKTSRAFILLYPAAVQDLSELTTTTILSNCARF